MKALLLAAGEGTRLRPLTVDRPKPMLPIAGFPVLEHLLALVRHYGVREIVINLHYKPDSIVEHFGDGSKFGVHVTYSREPRLLGSAGAAKRVEWLLDDTFLLLYGDVITDLNLTEMIELHRARGAVATLALYEVDEPSRCGIVQLAADDRVTRFVEKPDPSEGAGYLANAGIYVLERDVLDFIPAGQPHDFGYDVFPALLERGVRIFGHRVSGYVLDIGAPDRYRQAELDLQSGRYRSFARATQEVFP